MISGKSTGTTTTKIQMKPKPVVSKPKYQPPSIVKKKQNIQQPQQQQNKIIKSIESEKEEVKIVQLTEQTNSSAEKEQQFIMIQQPINKQEIVQIHTPIYGEVIVRYSHYKEKFPIKDGRLEWADIDSQYCLSHVFKGDFKLILKNSDKTKTYEFLQGGWFGCENNATYYLDVDEDPIQAEWDQKNSKPYQAPKDNTHPLRNKKVELLTEELKGMSIEEIKEKGGKYKELIEARDLEDILFK